MSNEAWLAGFFEGDGCVSLNARGHLTVEFEQRDCRALFRVAQLFGRGAPHKLRTRDIWRLRYHGADARDFLRRVRNFLGQPRADQADIALRAEFLPPQQARKLLSYTKREGRIG